MSNQMENPNGSIYLTDDPDTIVRKCRRAVTDSQACIAYRDEQPGIKNLINIYCACTDTTPEKAIKEMEGRGYGELKNGSGGIRYFHLKTAAGRDRPAGEGQDLSGRRD